MTRAHLPSDHFDDAEHEPFGLVDSLTVEYTEPEVLGVLYGPTGDPIAVVSEHRPFGYSK